MDWLGEIVDYGVIGLLLVLNLIVLSIFIERLVYYRNFKKITSDSLKMLEIKLSKGLSFIASVASNAPYLGLLGTVLGIMLTFYKMGINNNVNVTEIMIGLSLALKATAAGLVVALVAVTCYNVLYRKVKILLVLAEENVDG